MDILHRLIIEPLSRSYESFLTLLPGLFTSIVLIILGVAMGLIGRSIFLRIFHAVRFDSLAQRLGATPFLAKAGIKNPPSHLVSKLVQWIIIVTFFIVAMQNLKIPTVEHLVERLFLYLPNVFVAAFILIVGYILSNFLGRTALIALVNAGIKNSGLAAKFVRFIVFLLTATMALEQLGIGKDTIIVAFAITFGGVVLAFSIAFGFAGQEMARRYLEKKKEDRQDDDDLTHL